MRLGCRVTRRARRRVAAPSFEVLQRKAIEAADEETEANPRARSARLRWALRTDAPCWGRGIDDGPRLPGLQQLEGAAG